MFGLALLGLVASTLAVNIPTPKLTHLSTGDIELSLDDIPGAEQIDVAYSFGKRSFEGKFARSADSRWYHRNHDAQYNGVDKIKYRMIAEIDGNTIESNGRLTPGDVGVAALPPTRVRRGTVVFRDDFNGAFDASHWNYEVSMYGGYNWEVQVYVPDARNIYTKNGHLFIKPTLTTEDPHFNDGNMNSATMDMNVLYGYCTNADRYGCVREGQYGTLPPVMSGKLKSKATIRFGKVEVRARIPVGDWIWPAIWMLPRDSVYGGWPRSGEIDIMESRGNLQARDGGGNNHGVNEVGATLHWGPDAGNNRYTMTHGSKDGASWGTQMHTYRLEWTEHHIQVFVDDVNMMNIPINRSFWDKGGFSGTNIWSSGLNAAPFDKPFYLILNVAMAGSNGFFPDGWNYGVQKPWNNNSPTLPGDIWNSRSTWLQTWKGLESMEVDYVEMTQY